MGYQSEEQQWKEVGIKVFQKSTGRIREININITKQDSSAVWLWQAGTGSSALENREIQGQQNHGPLFIHRSLTSPPTLTGWNFSHQTGSKGLSALSKKRNSFSLCPWPHAYTQPSAGTGEMDVSYSQTWHTALAYPDVRSHVHP